jgi:hypothetical protein
MKECLDCGNISNQFLQPATVDCVALVDADGDFIDWKITNFEGPNFEENIFQCTKCESQNLKKIEEEN